MKKSSSWSARGVAVVAVLGLGLLAGTTQAEHRIYWCEVDFTAGSDDIKRMNLTGTNQEVFASNIGDCASGIAIDGIFDPRYVFYNVVQSNRIKRRPVTGGTITTIVDEGGSITGVAMDPPIASRIYYILQSGGSTFFIVRVDFNGGGATTVFTSTGNARDLAMDSIGNRLYWREEDGLHRAGQTGSNHEIIVSDSSIAGLAVERLEGKIYWTDTSPRRIRKANLNGTSAQTVLSLSNLPDSIAVDEMGKMYWVESVSGTSFIKRANVNGTSVETLATFDVDHFPASLGMELGFWSCLPTDPIGDIVSPHPQVNFSDVSRLVDCFRGLVIGDGFNECDLSPCGQVLGDSQCMGDGKVNFNDVSLGVDIFRNLPVCGE